MTELLEIPELETLKREVKRAERKGKKKATIEILIEMYQDGIEMDYLIKLAKKKKILEEEFIELLNENNFNYNFLSTLNEILSFI